MFVFYERKLLATSFPNVNKIADNLEMNEKPDRWLWKARGENRGERVAEQGGAKEKLRLYVSAILPDFYFYFKASYLFY